MEYTTPIATISKADYSVSYIFENVVMPKIRTLAASLPVVLARSGAPYFVADYMTNIVTMLNEKANTADYAKRFPLFALILDEKGSVNTVADLEFHYQSSFDLWIIIESSMEYNTEQRETTNFKAILTPLYYYLLTAIKQSQKYFRLGDGGLIEHDVAKEYYCAIKEKSRINEYADAIRVSFKNLSLTKNYKCN